MHDCPMQSPFFGSEYPCGILARPQAAACARRRVVHAAGRLARRDAPLPRDFDPARDPAKDLETALRIAQAARRSVMVEVGSESCTSCRTLDRFFASDAELKHCGTGTTSGSRSTTRRRTRTRRSCADFRGSTATLTSSCWTRLGGCCIRRTREALESGKDYDPAAMRAFLVKWAPTNRTLPRRGSRVAA